MGPAEFKKLYLGLAAWLREDDPQALSELYAIARDVRARHVGDQVHLRGLVDFSNLCERRCAYCGLRAGNKGARRYLMSRDMILERAAVAQQRGYGTIVLQAGEDRRIEAHWVADVVASIRDRFDLAITLSLGERSPDEYRLWKESGADRYLLKIETSDPNLYYRIHPPKEKGEAHRIEHLIILRELGYEIGSGMMVGIPGQTYAGLANDLRLFRELDLDMIGIGPFIPHPLTPLGRQFLRRKSIPPDQVENSDLMTCKALALARLLCPEANIPATTALSCVAEQGYLLGLNAGANVIMPNLTPPEYELLYDIYPKNRPLETFDLHADIIAQIAAGGLKPGQGPGGRKRTSVKI